jgi:hypothetical protein
MPPATTQPISATRQRGDFLLLVALAAAFALLHIATNGRYGFHRDEWQFLTEASHMDWGFVAFPPLDPFVERIGLSLFGLSLIGLRMFSVLAQAVALVVVGLMVRELGGRRWAQVSALLCVALAPLPMFNATEFQYTSFEFLWIVLAAYFVIRLLKTENPRWWLAIGVVLGLGMLTKYAITFFIAGILAGLVLTQARSYLLSKWFWAGVALALLLFLPNFLWLVHHDFISYTFLQHIHARDVRQGRGDHFLRDQLLVCINTAAAPLALAGLILYLRSARYRMLAFMYLVPFAMFWIGKGRGYYVAGAYPTLIAMGAVGFENWLARLSTWKSRTLQIVFFTNLVGVGAYVMALVLPLASSGPLRDFALKNNGDLREEFGWHELVRTVAGIRDSLTPEQQAHLGISAWNYGEAGSLELLGKDYGLPRPFTTTNTGWLRGYPTPQPTTIIVVGLSREDADELFAACRWAGHNGNSEGIRNEESTDHPDIFVCGPPRLSWPEFWKKYRAFG